jgi:acetyl esterase/lipase
MKTRILVASLLTSLLTLPALAQQQTPLWADNAIPNAIPGATITEKAETNGILRISNVSVPTLTPYLPAKDKATGAAVMICPGGGYWILAAEHEGSEVAKWFTDQGIAAFVLKYRLPNEVIMTNPHEVPLIDAMQGIRMIRRDASQYGIDPNRIGVMGFSAGGHLAATLATHWYQPEPTSVTQAKGLQSISAQPNFAILMYPVITFGEKAHTGSRDKLLGKLNNDPEKLAYYSNEKQVTKQTPPTLLVHAMDDKGVPVENSIDYYLACLRNGVPAEMHLYPTGGHGFGLRTANKGSVDNWPEAAKGWLKSLGAAK